MKSLNIAVSLALVLSTSQLAYAGPGHDHGHEHSHSHGLTAPTKLDDKGIIAAATSSLSAIINQKQKIEGKQLEPSWKNLAETAKSISKKGPGYSIVKMVNKNSKQTLYLILSDAGEIYDANFSGQFKGLKE